MAEHASCRARRRTAPRRADSAGWPSTRAGPPRTASVVCSCPGGSPTGRRTSPFGSAVLPSDGCCAIPATTVPSATGSPQDRWAGEPTRSGGGTGPGLAGAAGASRGGARFGLAVPLRGCLAAGFRNSELSGPVTVRFRSGAVSSGGGLSGHAKTGTASGSVDWLRCTGRVGAAVRVPRRSRLRSRGRCSLQYSYGSFGAVIRSTVVGTRSGV